MMGSFNNTSFFLVLLTFLFIPSKIVGFSAAGKRSICCGQSMTSTSRCEEVRTRTRIFLASTTEEQLSHTIMARTSLFDTVLRGNSTAAGELVGSLMEVRGTPQMDTLLDELLLPTEGNSFPLWSKIPYAAKFSKRARRHDLHMVLKLSTPSVDSETKEEGDLEDDPESMKRRTRRALFILLRNLASEEADDTFRDAGITQLKRIAYKDAKLDQKAVSAEDMLKRTPQGLETPQYEVLASLPNKGIEVRRYNKFAVCSVTMGDLNTQTQQKQAAKLSNPQLSGATSFGALAGYLFGKNQEQKAMKMTTPVLSVGNGDARTMSFVLPSDYWQDEAIDAAPKPLEGSAVKLTTDEGGARAVLMFGGFGRKSDVSLKSDQLLDVLSSDKEWEIVADQPTVTLAQYNDPFTPPWKRRNEVSVLVESKNGE